MFGLRNDEHSSTAESLPSAWQLLDQAKALEWLPTRLPRMLGAEGLTWWSWWSFGIWHVLTFDPTSLYFPRWRKPWNRSLARRSMVRPSRQDRMNVLAWLILYIQSHALHTHRISIYLSIYLSIYISIFLSVLYLFICTYIYTHRHAYIYILTHTYIYTHMST